MLDFASKYKEELKALYKSNVLGNERYLYLYSQNYWESDQPMGDSESDWHKIQRVSLNSEGKIVGYIEATYSRISYKADVTCLLNFYPQPNPFFTKEALQFLDDLFNKHGANKVAFSCYKRNPILPAYRKMVDRCGGREVGILEEDVILVDQKYHDKHLFEILKKNYRPYFRTRVPIPTKPLK